MSGSWTPFQPKIAPVYIYIYIYMYSSKPKNQTQHEMDSKICQNIKPPTTHIPFLVHTTKHLGKMRR